MRSRQCLRKSARQRHRSPCPSPKRLVGWARVALQPGEARTVSVAVPAQHFAVWMRMRTHGGSAREGTVLSAAASSRDPQALSHTVTLAAH